MDFITSLISYPIISWDFLHLLVRFAIDILITFFIVMVIYRPSGKDNSYIFTFFVFNVLIFFICYLMSSSKLGIGFAFGLFALFSILRYRTTTIQIKEMTYLFTVVCIAVINALCQMSLAEWLFTDLTILLVIFVMERQMFKDKPLKSTKVFYNNMTLLQPEKKALLLADLRNRTGLKIQKVEINQIDLIDPKATLVVYYEN